MKDITFIRDSREKDGFKFEGFEVIVKGLKTGDYSILDYENKVVVERKRKDELFTNFGKGRKRFMAELERMKEIPYRYLVIESSLTEILKGCRHAKMHVNSVFGSLLSLFPKYGVSVVFAENKKLAEKVTAKLLLLSLKYLKEKEYD